jgi:Ni/Fe-hydrogenase subunit HybB-like protein
MGLLFAGIAGAPLLWLTALQTGYVLAYQACDDRSRSWVAVPTLIALALAIGIAVVSVVSSRRASRERLPMPFLGWLAIGMSALIVIVLVASTVAPLILHPCD